MAALSIAGYQSISLAAADKSDRASVDESWPAVVASLDSLTETTDTVSG